VQRLLSLLRLRNTHSAFQGICQVEATEATRLVLAWRNGTATAQLDVDLLEMRAAVTCSTGGRDVMDLVWRSNDVSCR
jgi:hypothetical protein